MYFIDIYKGFLHKTYILKALKICKILHKTCIICNIWVVSDKGSIYGV